MIPGGRAHKHEQKKPSFPAKGGSPHNSALAARWQERKMPSIAHAPVAAPLLPLRPTPLYSPFTAFVHHSFPAFFSRSPLICMSSLFTAQRCCAPVHVANGARPVPKTGGKGPRNIRHPFRTQETKGSDVQPLAGAVHHGRCPCPTCCTFTLVLFRCLCFVHSGHARSVHALALLQAA